MKAMAKRAAERYQSAQELADTAAVCTKRADPGPTHRLHSPAGALGQAHPWWRVFSPRLQWRFAPGLVSLDQLSLSWQTRGQAAKWAREEAEGNAAENRRLAAEQMVRQGVRLQEEGDFAGALLLLPRPLQHDENDPDRAERIDCACSRWSVLPPSGTHLGPCGSGVVAGSPRMASASSPNVPDRTVRSGTSSPVSGLSAAGAGTAQLGCLSDDGRKVNDREPARTGVEGGCRKCLRLGRRYGRRLFRQSSSREVSCKQLHLRSQFQPQLSPDGRRVLTRVDSGKVQVWSTETGKPMGPPLEHGCRCSGRVSRRGTHPHSTVRPRTKKLSNSRQAAGRPRLGRKGKSLLKLEPRKGRHRAIS